MSHLSPLLQQSSRILAERGEGSWLYDADGNAWLDFTCGIGVTSTGHCHPTVVAAAREQLSAASLAPENVAADAGASGDRGDA